MPTRPQRGFRPIAVPQPYPLGRLTGRRAEEKRRHSCRIYRRAKSARLRQNWRVAPFLFASLPSFSCCQCQQFVQVAAMARSFSQPQHEPQLPRGKRRAQGVFYTPVEIAEWIVQQTYGPLLAKWQGDEPPPRILDPACGAGVFLTAAASALRTRCQQLELSDFKAQQAV